MHTFGPFKYIWPLSHNTRPPPAIAVSDICRAPASVPLHTPTTRHMKGGEVKTLSNTGTRPVLVPSYARHSRNVPS